MANLRVSLTDSLCSRARPEAKEYTLRDTGLPGLCLRAQPSGARSWIVRGRIGEKQAKWSLGGFPDLSVKAARQAAAALLSGATAPAPTIPPAPTFAVFQEEHERLHARLYKPSGLRTYRSYVSLQILPAFGKKRLDQITRPSVVRWFERYSATSPGGANRALAILHQILATAADWGRLPPGWINPANGVRHNRRKSVGAFLSEAQMERLGTVLAERIDSGCAVAALLRFLTLTGCRVGEAIDLEWGDVLPDRLRLRDSKTGARDVVIGMPVRRFLAGYRKRAMCKDGIGSPVFPLPSGQGYETVRSIWFSVRREAGLPSKLRLHDLRHSFASHSVMAGETLLTTSLLLGHARIQTTFRYAHLADAALSTTAESIGAMLVAEVSVRTRKTRANDGFC
jgi:integrase